MKKIIFSCVFSSIVLLCIFLFLEFSFLKKHNQENLFSFVFLNYNLSRFLCVYCVVFYLLFLL
ncbi:hypothetical protein C414_000230084 [Campylobacter jejuni subsp. jejuni 414]|nr:hypothetical protein C414_000230084 [Campylobacter jejuni subsp. jejuni 414]